MSIMTLQININMYIGCETSGGAWSSASSGSNLRYNLVDVLRHGRCSTSRFTTLATSMPSRTFGSTWCL